MNEQIDFARTIQTFVGATTKFDADLAKVVDRRRAGELTEEQALAEMIEIVAKDPEVLAVLEEAITGGNPATKVPLPRLNPLFEAALMERAQFDGDIPELRTGLMSEGTQASVSVQLTGSNPIAGGLMLKQASEEMTRKVQGHEAERMKGVQKIIEENQNANATKLLLEGSVGMVAATQALAEYHAPDIGALVRGSAETDLPEYMRGSIPSPVALALPDVMVLANLTPEQKKEAAWKLLSTTQGRRSAKPVIERLLGADLSRKGFIVTFREPAETTDVPLAIHEWTVKMSGTAETQPSFSFIDIAARVLSAGLRSKCPEDIPSKAVCIEVSTVNQIADRIVGWSARMFPAW